nr:ABC transporter ATPase [Corynebacterium striatum]
MPENYGTLDSMIEVEGLTKQYKSVRAVDDLTFKVEPGIVTGFLGPNGAGKSTTMRMILGLDSPTAGQARINGKTYRELKNPLREVGALLDAKAVHPNRTAANHLKWMAQSNGIPTKRVEEVLGLVGLSDVAGKKAGGFSLGMGQRLGLAGALLGDPGILILDEPVNGLDPEGIRWVRSLVRALAAEGRTVLISSHLLSEMSLTADHLVVIGRGRLVANQSTYDFVKEHSQSSVIVRSDHLEEFGGALREANVSFRTSTDEEGRNTFIIEDQSTDFIGQLAYSTGVPLNELSLKRASLEDAFMQMTGEDVQYHASTPGAPATNQNIAQEEQN